MRSSRSTMVGGGPGLLFADNTGPVAAESFASSGRRNAPATVDMHQR